ncbi:MAG: DHH family phosphoesterase [Thermocladium sp.]
MMRSLQLFREKQRIVIAVHRNPDLDAVASSALLNSFLSSIGKETCLAAQGKPTMEAATLLNALGVSVNYGSCNASGSVLVVLDSASNVQLGNAVEEKPIAVVVIDHHAVRNIKGDIELIDEASPSTLELVYELVKAAGFKPDSRIAQLCLAALIDETGRFSRAGARTLEVAAELIRLGASYSDAVSIVRREKDGSTRMAMLKGVLRMRAYRHGDTVYCVTAVDAFESLVANKLIELGCSAAFVVSDHEEEIRVIGRGRGVDVASILQALGRNEAGEGGGHREAAALVIRDSTVNHVMEQLIKFIKSRGASPMVENQQLRGRRQK